LRENICKIQGIILIIVLEHGLKERKLFSFKKKTPISQVAPPLRERVSSPNQDGRRGPPHWICRQKGARSLVDTKPTRSLLWKRQGPGKREKEDV